MKSKFKIIGLFLLFTVMWGCQDIDNPVVDTTESVSDPQVFSIDPDILKFLEMQGFQNINPNEILETEHSIVIEGDIAYRKIDIENFLKVFNNDINKQRRNSYIIDYTSGSTVTYYYKFDPGVSTDIKNSVKYAFDRYNELLNFGIKFQETTGSGYNVYVQYNYGLPSTQAAQAYLPYFNGSTYTVGHTMEINPTKYNTLSTNQKRFISVHEIGHLVGLRHNDDTSYSLMPGTFATDNYSVYNSATVTNSLCGGCYAPDWTHFQYMDQLTLKTMYPLDASQKPIYAYVKDATGGFNYLTTWNTYQYSGSGYTYWGFIGYGYSSYKSGTTALYRYRHNVTGVDYLSFDSNLGATYPGYVKLGLAAYVYTSSNSSRNPVYEWYHPSKGFYFTTHTSDAVTTSGGWTGGSVAFYTLKVDQYN